MDQVLALTNYLPQFKLEVNLKAETLGLEPHIVTSTLYHKITQLQTSIDQSNLLKHPMPSRFQDLQRLAIE